MIVPNSKEEKNQNLLRKNFNAKVYNIPQIIYNNSGDQTQIIKIKNIVSYIFNYI